MSTADADNGWLRLMRVILLAGGLALILFALLLPVDAVVERAIPESVVREISAKGTPERLLELQGQFRGGLTIARIVAGVFGGWLLLVGGLLRTLLQCSEKADTDAPGAVRLIASREYLIPCVCALLAVALSVPMLGKGFDHAELMNLVMLARRGPFVSMACQNSPPRAAQPAFTVMESLSVKAFGENEATARLPALVFGVLVFFPLYVIARRYGPPLFASMVCVGLAVTGVFVFSVTYAKGYSLAATAYLGCVAMTALIAERSTWWRWSLLGLFAILAGYAHLTSVLYIACLGILLIINLALAVWGRSASVKMVACALVQPIVVWGTVVFVLLQLYSVGIPTELKYMAAFDLTNYYQSYHINLRFLKVMAELWSWIRDFTPLAWTELALALAGLVWALKRAAWLTAYLVVPGVVVVASLWARDLFVYPRFFLHFLPVYVLLAVIGLWRILERIKLSSRQAASVILAFFFVTGILSARRLYAMERCGVKSAVQDARAASSGGDVRVMGLLDGYVTVLYYDPQAVSGYRDRDFWQQMNQANLPEFVISVPYLDMDIPGATQALLQKYDLFRHYPSWLDVDDDQDSVYLYRRKDFSATPALGGVRE